MVISKNVLSVSSVSYKSSLIEYSLYSRKYSINSFSIKEEDNNVNI